MDEIKDFFKDLQERVTSPVFGSFIISWLICNWDLVLLILFNNADTLKQDRYALIYLSFKNHSIYHLLILPLFGSIVYVLGYPYLKNWVKKYNAQKKAKNEHEILLATTGYSIPLERYIEQLDTLEKEKAKLANLVVEQAIVREERNEAVSKMNQIKMEANEKENRINLLLEETLDLKSDKMGLLYGTWTASLKTKNGKMDEQWYFESNIIETSTGSYGIKDFLCNNAKTLLAFRITLLGSMNVSFIMPDNLVFSRLGADWIFRTSEHEVLEIRLSPLK